MALRLKKGDRVQVISGKWKGAQGEILRVLPKDDRAIVEGVNVIKKHQKPRSQEDPGGIISKEAPIHISNLMILDPETQEPTRFSTKVTEQDGKRVKVRVSTRSGAEIS